MRRPNLPRPLTFFVVTFAWTWACYAPMALTGQNPYAMPWLPLLIAGGMGPSLIGVVLVQLGFDRSARRDFWRRCFSVRPVDLPSWLVIGLLFPLIWAVSIGADLLLGGDPPGMVQWTGLLAAPQLWPLVLFISLMSGPWSEEFGWRGYALDPLLQRFGTWRGSLLLGGLWGVWHLPLYSMPGTWHAAMGYRFAGLWSFLLLNLGLALVMTWAYLRNGRSILTGLLLHFAANLTSQLVAPVSDRVEITRSLLTLAAGLVACSLLPRDTRTVGPRARAAVNGPAVRT